MKARRWMRYPAAMLLHRRFQHVILHVTERCDLRCKTCFVDKRGREMGIDAAKAVAHKLGRVRWLDIGGGEPFLHSDLPAICRLFPGAALTIPTNGQRPEQIFTTVKTLASESQRELTVAVSLDGFRETNDSIRGEGAFDKAMDCFRLLRDIPGMKVKINTVVCNRNSEELTRFMAFVREAGPDYHSLLLLRGTPADGSMALPPLEFLTRLTPDVLRILGSYDYGDRGNPMLRVLKKRYQGYVWRLCLKTLAEQRCFVPCQAPLLHKVVYVDGATSMCELMPPAGNILEESAAVLEEKMIEALERHECIHGRCFCTHNCNLGENIQSHMPSVLAVLLGIDP